MRLTSTVNPELAEGHKRLKTLFASFWPIIPVFNCIDSILDFFMKQFCLASSFFILSLFQYSPLAATKDLTTLMVSSKYTKGEQIPVINAISHLIALILTTNNKDKFYKWEYEVNKNGKRNRVEAELSTEEYQNKVLMYLNGETSCPDKSIKVKRGLVNEKGECKRNLKLDQFKTLIEEELKLVAIADISQLNTNKAVNLIDYLLNPKNSKFNNYLLPLLDTYKNKLENPDTLQSLIDEEKDLPNIDNLRHAAFKIYLEKKEEREKNKQSLPEHTKRMHSSLESSNSCTSETNYKVPEPAAFLTVG